MFLISVTKMKGLPLLALHGYIESLALRVVFPCIQYFFLVDGKKDKRDVNFRSALEK